MIGGHGMKDRACNHKMTPEGKPIKLRLISSSIFECVRCNILLSTANPERNNNGCMIYRHVHN